MKFDKNDFQVLSLLIGAIAIVVSIFSIISDRFLLSSINESKTLLIATLMITLLTIYTATFTVLQRVKPKKYIYISYAHDNKELAEMIISEMNEQFLKTSKFRYEFYTADSISYGYDMEKTVESYIEKSDIIIVIVSKAYLNSEWCKNEFMGFTDKGKRIIPIVTESFEDLSLLPVNLSNIKALSLINVETDSEIKERLSKLVVDLIKQRKY